MNQDDQSNRSEECEAHSQSSNGFSNPSPREPRGLPQTIPTRIFISALCIAVAVTILLTSVITSGSIRRKYINEIASINYQLNLLQDTMDGDAPIGLLLGILEKYSYYDDGLTDRSCACGLHCAHGRPICGLLHAGRISKPVCRDRIRWYRYYDVPRAN